MKTHNTSKKKTSGSYAPSRWHRGRFRRKLSPHMVVKGQLRMRSPSGVFVMVGISVVLVGMTIAVIGYWPHRTKSGSGRAGNSNVTGEIRKEIKVSPQARLFLHSEKLKLIGPVVMGVGLFIFICANTMLYENRDMETRLLMQQELYSMGLNFSQDTGPASDYFQRRRTTSSTLRANAECVEGYYEVDLSSRGFLSCSSPVKKWVDSCNSSRLQTTTQFSHHKSISPSLSLLSIHSDSGNAVPENGAFSFARGTESILSTAVNALPLPLIKLNNCLLEKQSVSRVGVRDLGSNCRLPEEKEEVRRLSWAFLPGCSNHVVPRKDTLKDSHVVIDMDSTPHSGTLVGEFHECAKREFPNSGHSKSLDLGQRRTTLLAPSIDRKHRSWPRLDHIGLLNYAKLESQGESSDRLLGASKELFRGGEHFIIPGNSYENRSYHLIRHPKGTVLFHYVRCRPCQEERGRLISICHEHCKAGCLIHQPRSVADGEIVQMTFFPRVMQFLALSKSLMECEKHCRGWTTHSRWRTSV